MDQFVALIDILGSVYAGMHTPRLIDNYSQTCGVLPINLATFCNASIHVIACNMFNCIGRTLCDRKFVDAWVGGLFIYKASWKLVVNNL